MRSELIKRSAVIRFAKERIRDASGISRVSPVAIDALCAAGERAIENQLLQFIEAHDMASTKSRKRRTLGAYGSRPAQARLL